MKFAYSDADPSDIGSKLNYRYFCISIVYVFRIIDVTVYWRTKS